MFLLVCAPLLAPAQQYLEDPEVPRENIKGYLLSIRIEANGDTTFFDTIDPVWIFPRGRSLKGRAKSDWRQYYKLVYNFNKVYPYALVGRKLIAQVDSTINAGDIKRSERNRYVKDVEKELFSLFEKDIRKMTITQGMVLMRLVDRECGMSGYDIIKTYENGFVATFWQLVAKLFSQDLKTRYDPTGKDARLEHLVQIWDSGKWDAFYYSIFYEHPQKVVVKCDRLNSDVKRKKGSSRQSKDKEKPEARNQE